MSFDLLEWVDANLTRARPSAGDEWTAECPFCGEYGGFYVNTDPEKNGPWVCFKCSERGGSATMLVAHVEDITPVEAKALLLKGTVEFRRRETADTLVDRIKAIRNPESLDDVDLLAPDVEEQGLPPEFIPVWDGKKWRVPRYMTDRRFKRATLRDWGVGYCERGKYGGRVIIPMDCPNGRSFTARDLTDKQEPKYLNPPGIDHRRLVFGWKQAPLHGDFTLVEGPTDAMKLYQHRISSMAVGGKVLSAEQLGMLFKRPAEAAVTVMLDPEAYKDALAAATQLITHFKMVFVARLPGGTDPGKSTHKQATKAHTEAARFTGDRSPMANAAIESSRRKLQEKYGK